MPQASPDDLFDKKVCNCIRWVDAMTERYPGLKELLDLFGWNSAQLLTNRKERETFITAKLPMLVMSSESSVLTALQIRDFFEMNETQRIEFLQQQVVPRLKHYASIFQSVAEFVDNSENEKTISDDMRLMGGYTQLFTEQYLRKPEKLKE